MNTTSPTSLPASSKKISGVIVARNEEDKIAFALESIRSVVDEIIFFDMDSSDRTGEIAASYGAQVFRVAAMGAQEPARPLAVQKAAGPWILMLDADELLSPDLCKRILEVAACDDFDVVSLPRQNYLFGKVMTGALMGANDDRQIRFFRKGNVDIWPRMHFQPTIKPGSRILNLTFPADGAIIHFNYLDIDNYLEKFSRYTRLEALEPNPPPKYSLGKTILRAGYEFINRYVRKGGYRDGWRGFYIALSMSFYKITIWARLSELKEVGSASEIRAIYAREAKAMLANMPGGGGPI
jgi:glycosyltransferase involved in cell wall biosynthesis